MEVGRKRSANEDSNDGTNDQPKSKKRKKKRNDSDSDEGGDYKSSVLVYDSDEEEDDIRVSDKMSGLQKRVLSFLNNGSAVEFLQVEKLKAFKSVSTSFLNSVAQFLKTRDTISRLMKRCVKLAEDTEASIKEGDGKIKQQPSLIDPNYQLKSYQIVGLNWLNVMYQQQLSAILADEMGLGKTIQIISFLAHIKEIGDRTGPHLIVAPTSTLDNWLLEFNKWCPSLGVFIYHGSMDERRITRIRWFKQEFQGIDVIITSYKLITASNEEKRMFKIIPFQYVVFDEAHMLKNMNTQRYFYLFNIRAEHRVLLTGTPLQNNLLELMSLLNFVMPDVFSSKIDHIKSFFSKNSKVPIENLPSFEQEQIDLAKRIMRPFILRRLKDDVLQDLPKKTSEIIKCPLVEGQKKLYEKFTSDIRELALNCKEDYNHMWAFMQLRRCANHPLATRLFYEGDLLSTISAKLAKDRNYKLKNPEQIFDELMCLCDIEIHQLTLRYDTISQYSLEDPEFLESGKCSKLDELLPNLKSDGHRVIIFSQFIFVLDILENYMRIRGHSYLRFDGATKGFERQGMIDSYNDDSSIFAFLLTTKAGGVGINLTAADTVILHDVDFNPHNDKQAEDRCHRVGQTKPVHVIRLISEGTVEEEIFEKAQGKLSLERELSEEDNASEENKNVELLLKEILGLTT